MLRPPSGLPERPRETFGVPGARKFKRDLANLPSRATTVRDHPVARSQGHLDVEDAGAGRMRACAISCHASRCARMFARAPQLRLISMGRKGPASTRPATKQYE